MFRQTTVKQGNPVQKEEKKEDFKSLAKSFLTAVLFALLFRTFLFEPFHIPTGSMKPTLVVGDYIFVSKYSYGFSRYSFPFGPHLFDGRIGEMHKPERGDVVVFKLPTDTSTNYIKRLVGLPGDRIQVRDGVLFINDAQVALYKIDPFKDSNSQIIQQLIETLPNGVKHRVLDQTQDGALDNTGVYEVPAGHYFFMGDNRDNSQDSRVLEKVGYVPEENLVGRAEVIFYPDSASWWQPWTWFARVNTLPQNAEIAESEGK